LDKFTLANAMSSPHSTKILVGSCLIAWLDRTTSFISSEALHHRSVIWIATTIVSAAHSKTNLGEHMKSIFSRLMAIIAGTIISLGVCAQERGTKEEATAMVEKAVALIKSAGADAAAKEFMTDAKWKSKDLYISMYRIKDQKCVVVAHGINEKLVGKDITDLKDADDKFFIRDAIGLAAKGGWVDYKWPDPATKKVNPKSSFIKGVPGTEYAVLVGIYK
jgi:signal transduction histidine kinase